MGRAPLRAGKRQRENWQTSTLALNTCTLTCHWPHVTHRPDQLVRWGRTLLSEKSPQGTRPRSRDVSPSFRTGREEVGIGTDSTTGLCHFSSNTSSHQPALPSLESPDILEQGGGSGKIEEVPACRGRVPERTAWVIGSGSVCKAEPIVGGKVLVKTKVTVQKSRRVFSSPGYT